MADRYMVAEVTYRPMFKPRACYTSDGDPKVPFETKHDAKIFLQAKEPGWRRVGLDIYRCFHCRQWHYGHGDNT